MQPATGSTVIFVTLACTATATVLLTPPAVTVTVAIPLTGLPPLIPLQLMGVVSESQTPAQTNPALETVTMALFDDEKVMLAVT